MNDIIPPKRPIGAPARPSVTPPNRVSPPLRSVPLQNRPAPIQQPAAPVALPQSPQKEASQTLQLKPGKRSKKKLIAGIIIGVIMFVLALMASAVLWYNTQLRPVASGDAEKVSVTIPTGATAGHIGQLLEEKKLIRSSLAFDIYIRLSPGNPAFRAGTYSVSPADSTSQIIGYLVSGEADELVITFLPGATLAQNREVLLKAGFASSEVDAAFGKEYQHPLFTDKPAGTDLEGYIYGETYHFSADVTVERVLQQTFDQYYQVITKNNLITAYKQRELSLYQGITLASIIQREVSGAADQKQVAQIFFTRLDRGISLGSDVTYQYAAKKLGVTPSPDLDSPYNTRKFPGLPPGPIATPGLTALQAVASPASGDYLYFLSGDDDKTYFAHTNEEHEANVRDHCQKKCLIP
jgi:UPF0755 protein